MQLNNFTRINLMTDSHPITPSPELVQQWRDLPEYTDGRQKVIMITLSREKFLDIVTQAARWGADQELEACCEWVSQWRCMVGGNRPEVGLRAARSACCGTPTPFAECGGPCEQGPKHCDCGELWMVEPEPAVPEGREPASVAQEPSDADLLATLNKATATFPPRHPEAEGLNAVEYPLALELRKARAVLARWGNPAPQPPADGKVAKLVEWLRMQGEAQKPGLNSLLCKKTKKELQTNGERLIRAADLLQQQAPVPVSVSERLPGPEDCDAEGRCWVWWKNGVRWVLDEWTQHELREGLLSDHVSHWLPAHALPIPTAND